MSTVSIDKAVPMPEGRRFGPRAARYPYADMELTDSFAVPYGEANDEERAVIARRMRQSATWANRRFAPNKFSVREVEGGVRVWRIA